MKIITIKVSDEDKIRLESHAKSEGKSMSKFIYDGVFSYINKTDVNARADSITKTLRLTMEHLIYLKWISKEILGTTHKDDKSFNDHLNKIDFAVMKSCRKAIENKEI
jgi:hypothetical protein